MDWRSESSFIKYLKKFISNEEIKKYLEEDNWNDIFRVWNERSPSIEFNGFFVDFLIDNNIVFDIYLTNVPAYAFARSELYKEAALKKVEEIGSRAFRKSNIEKILLSSNVLKKLGTGVLSGCDKPITIMWDGSYAEWKEISEKVDYLYMYRQKVTIKCIDGVFEEIWEGNTI